MFRHANRGVVISIYSAMCIMLLISIVIATNIGAVSVSPSIVFKIIVNNIAGENIFDPNEWDFAKESIIWNLRFPKVIVTAFTGAGLAICGIYMQVLTKNTLADPYILGISSGAASGATLSILIGSLPVIGSFSIQVGAFFGALISIALVMIIAGKSWSDGVTRLVLVGMAVASLFSAVTNFIIFITPDSRKLNSALFWMTGSFSGVSWSDMPPVIVCVAIGILVSIGIHGNLDAMLLGETMAGTKGVDTKKIKIIIVVVSTLITAVLVSISGVIGFVGLVIPHIGRMVMGTMHRKNIPISMLLGANFMVWADAVARVCIAPSEMPVGVITSLIGVPFFLFMIRKSRYGFGG